MTVRRPSLLRIAQLALAVLAVCLTAAGVKALLVTGEDRQRTTSLIDRYTAAFQVDGDPKDKDDPQASSKDDPQAKAPATKPAGTDGATTKKVATKPAGTDGATTKKVATNPAGKDGATTKKVATKPAGTDGATTKKVVTESAGTGGKKGDNAPKSPQSPSDKRLAEQLARIAKRHIFSPAPSKKKFQSRLTGVLGETAYFGGKGYKVGQTVDGAKVQAIGADWVQIEFEGKSQKLHVFGPGGGPSPGGPGRPTFGPEGRPPGGMTMPSPGGRRRGRGEMPAGFKLTPSMIEQFKGMPPEMREKALEHMPAEIRTQLEKAL